MAKIGVAPKWVVFPKISVEANSEFDVKRGAERHPLDLACSLQYDLEDKVLQASLSVQNEEYIDKNIEYKIDIHVYSVFSISKNFYRLPDSLIKEITTDVASFLIGTMREIIANITSRGPWGTYLVPLLSVEQLTDQLLENMSEDKSNFLSSDQPDDEYEDPEN